MGWYYFDPFKYQSPSLLESLSVVFLLLLLLFLLLLLLLLFLPSPHSPPSFFFLLPSSFSFLLSPSSSSQGLPMLPRLALNSWAEETLLPQPPENLELQVHTTEPGNSFSV
jgi:hypothetical protein